MKDKLQFKCLNENCRTVVVGHGYRMDGIRCPRCDGPVVPMPFKSFKNQEKLLVVELDSYDSVPKVYLNGAEIKGGMVSVFFDWKTKDKDTPKIVPSFEIKYLVTQEGIPVANTIAFDDPFKD